MIALEEKHQIINWKDEKKLLGIRMSEKGAAIRSKSGVMKALQENREQMEHLGQAGIQTSSELKHYYRIRDLLFSQRMYLEAILDYIERGGTSRGSYLIQDENGLKPLPELSDIFSFSLETNGMEDKIQEIKWDKNGIKCEWREVRPIPKEDNWFEKVWKDYREEKYYEMI